MTTASSPVRSAWAALFALLLALRLLGSAGYMPEVDHGRLTIIVCPGADGNAPLAIGTSHHHHGQAGHGNNLCPYAAAAALGALGNDFEPMLALVLLGTALLVGGTLVSAERQARRERPPATGPPLPA